MTLPWGELQLQANIDGVVHHSVSWSLDCGGTTCCGITYRWADADSRAEEYQAYRDRVPAKRFRGDATCVVCVADERDR